nr:serine/threonine-protein kinase [Ramlibacter cellulosilyticus]
MKKLGRYEVLRVLGKGAMGVVYEGRDPNLDRRVAIKTVKVENLSEEAAAEYEHRFRTEARSAARLQHPNIVSVYDSDRDGDVAFLVMEYIQGDDLKHHLDRGVRYSLEQSLKIVRDLLSALDYAHKQGIVHRDIKPANLLIEPGGRVKLTDFGVARIQDSGEATRTQGSMVGTLKYMAPEQVQGQKIDSRADLFSVGVVLYQLLTDKRPFDGDNDFSIIHQIIGHHPPPPSSVNPRLPAALDAVVARALAKTREERFATARDFAVALQAAIRRAEDQTVVPPLNPNRRQEPGSRPLTRPGTVPPQPGLSTAPSIGGASSVTQELELVYWKDVKDSADVEDLQGFLDKFPDGIYADLARRRLRKLVGGDSTTVIGTSTPANATTPSRPAAPPAGAYPGTGSTFATQFPDNEATRLRTDTSRPAVGADLSQPRPAQWVQEEFTNTVIQKAAAPAPVPAQAAALAPPAPAAQPAAATPLQPGVAKAATLSSAAAAASYAAAVGAALSPGKRPAAEPESTPAESEFPATEIMPPAPAPAAAPRARRVADDDTDSLPPPPAKKKLPVAVLAGVGAIAVAGLLAVALTRGKAPEAPPPADVPVLAAPGAPAGSSGTAAAPPPAPVDVPAPAAPPAATLAAAANPPDTPMPAAPPAAAPAAKAAAPAAAPRKAASQPARVARATTPVAPEPVRPASPAAPARVDPEPVPKPLPPPVASNGNLAAVDQCRDKFLLAKESCLAENCAKPGARSHPLCVKHREEVRLREEGKVRQGPQQAP